MSAPTSGNLEARPNKPTPPYPPMKNFVASLVVITVLPVVSLAADHRDDFNQAPLNQPPPGWTIAITGQGEPRWIVTSDPADPATRVLRQEGTVSRPCFPLCLKSGAALTDGFVETRFKSVSGKIDQAAGVVWRWRDSQNYYICRANALENNVVAYKVVEGKRTALEIVGRTGGYGVAEKVAPAQWHTLRVEFAGNTFIVRFNGKELFRVRDDTFASSGLTGLWTKADSVMLFDDFSCGATR